MKTILIVDDDVYISGMLCRRLQSEGYDTVCAFSGTEALMVLNTKKIDLILLDLMLPGLTGEELLQKISDIPVIVLSAKSEIGGKVELLKNGAADYITKPFNMEELCARIGVQFRINSRRAEDKTLKFREITLDTVSHSVTVSGEFVKLTRTEYAILKYLMYNAGRVVTKSRILDLISEDTPDCTEATLKVHISNLRKKLRAFDGHDYIEAVWGIGFKLADEY